MTTNKKAPAACKQNGDLLNPNKVDSTIVSSIQKIAKEVTQ